MQHHPGQTAGITEVQSERDNWGWVEMESTLVSSRLVSMQLLRLTITNAEPKEGKQVLIQSGTERVCVHVSGQSTSQLCPCGINIRFFVQAI